MSREKVLKYAEEKEKIEREMKEIVEYLSGPGMPGVKGSLVDAEGFPLSGVDLYQIRQARQRHNILNTDYTCLMSKIEAELHSYFGNSESVNNIIKEDVPIRIEIGLNDTPVPFAEISEITEGSPAHTAGLIVHDKVISFGNINYTNHNALNNLASFVRENEGNQIRIAVLKPSENRVVTLNITPQRWSGAGILGCRLKPLN